MKGMLMRKGGGRYSPSRSRPLRGYSPPPFPPVLQKMRVRWRGERTAGSGGPGRLWGGTLFSPLLLPAGILAGNRFSPAPTRTPLARVTPAVQAVDPWLISLLLSCLLAFGIPSLALVALLRWEGSRYTVGAREAPRSWPRAVVLAAAAVVMWISAILILVSLGARLGKAGLITTAVPLTAPVVYLGLSALVLSRGAARGRKHPLLATLHVPLAVIVLGGLAAIYAVTPVRREAAVLTLAASLLGSALLAFWHGPKAPVEAPVPASVGVTTLSQPAETASEGPQAAAATSPGPAVRFPPELEGRFRNAEYLGGGGVARVYRARLVPDGREVVVKIPLRSDEATGRSFLKEIRVWEELHHPRIVEILSANILPIPYVVMEYHPRSLDRVVLPLPVPEAARLMAGILDGLAHAHARGIVHRDLKPQNILLGADGEPRIADWGLSTTLEGGTPGTVEGFSLAYAAPEQVAPERFGGTDPRTDLYQAGVLFYELVTGRPPFPGGSLAEQTRAILEVAPAPPSSLVPAARSVDRIILRCLEKEKSRRYQSAGELAAEIALVSARG